MQAATQLGLDGLLIRDNHSAHNMEVFSWDVTAVGSESANTDAALLRDQRVVGFDALGY